MLRPARLAVLAVPFAALIGACALTEMRSPRSAQLGPGAEGDSADESSVEEIAVTGSSVARTEVGDATTPGSKVPPRQGNKEAAQPGPAAPIVAATPPPPPSPVTVE